MTANMEEPIFPAASLAVQTTILTPIGYILESMVKYPASAFGVTPKLNPASEHVGPTVTPTLSIALTVNPNSFPDELSAATVISSDVSPKVM